MGNAIANIVFKKGEDDLQAKYDSVNQIPIKTIKGEEGLVADHVGGKKLYLIVNVASKWGMAKVNFIQLIQLYNEFRDMGLEVLAFPCNQFNNGEPGTNEEIEFNLRSKLGAEFPIFEKVEVNGKNPHEIFRYLRCNPVSDLWDPKKKRAKEIPWNFAKFLCNSEG